MVMIPSGHHSDCASTESTTGAPVVKRCLVSARTLQVHRKNLVKHYHPVFTCSYGFVLGSRMEELSAKVLQKISVKSLQSS